MTQTLLSRQTRLQAAARAAGLDYIALVPGPNLLYFTGLHMHLSERPFVALLPADDTRAPVMVVPHFETGKATAAAGHAPWSVYAYRDGEPFERAFEAAAQAHALEGALLGVEPTQMRLIEWNLLTGAAGSVRQASALDMIATLRMVKDESELVAMRKAVRVAEDALARTLEQISGGMTEKDIAGRLMSNLLQGGADGLAFSPLIQIGASASNPHGVSGDRALQPGDCLLFDFGALVDDYPSDITRTVFFGEPSAEMRRVYETVKAANAAGRAAVRPGTTPEAIDASTRAVIEAAGLGEYFTHRTGHGLGLEIHEPPYLWAGNQLSLQPGTTFTVEPGCYLPGLGGVRIEDNVVVTETGVESLTSFTRDLIVLPA
jgi:Xaa-Pro dipeptidase